MKRILICSTPAIISILILHGEIGEKITAIKDGDIVFGLGGLLIPYLFGLLAVIVFTSFTKRFFRN